jgi:uncharacterized ParB-like nuclease family protein
MNSPIKNIDVQKVKSKWYTDIFSQWQPDQGYIEFLEKKIADGEYVAPIVVVKEDDDYYIVNGHHRYYALCRSGKKTIKCVVIEGSFDDSEPLRKAEVLLKEFDRKTEYRYQLSGYLDRWAADAEQQTFINKYRPTAKFRIHALLKKIKTRIFG